MTRDELEQLATRLIVRQSAVMLDGAMVRHAPTVHALTALLVDVHNAAVEECANEAKLWEEPEDKVRALKVKP